jgi:hypothetical protein
VKHRWTVDLAVSLTREQAQRAWVQGRIKAEIELPRGRPRHIYCSRCWTDLDHRNLDGECAGVDEKEVRG